MRKTIFAIALMSAMSVMAQEHAEVDVHARYTKVVTPVNGKYESKRPPVAERLFTSEAVEKKIKEVQKLLKKNPKLAWMFANCYPNTLESTVHYRQLANGDDDTFVYTGDIPAMWLRDSGAQVWPYVALANKDEKLKKMLRGVILRQLKCINIDRYANAYNDGPTGAGWQKDDTEMKAEVFERKYEIDSFCYPIRLAYEYWKVTGDDSIFGEDWMQAIGNILKTFHEQQRKETAKAYHFTRMTDRAFDTVGWDGFGAPVKPVGLIASLFRPSDDATILPFLIPSNFMAVYAYEVDGFGNHLLMDDANVPSLLGMGYLGDVEMNDPIYQNTRRFVWSEDNPCFFRGKAGEGIGGPHIGYDMPWPMSIMMKCFTAQSDDEIRWCMKTLLNTDAGMGFIHESFHKDDASKYTRAWFAWQNTLFGELVIKLINDGKVDLLNSL